MWRNTAEGGTSDGNETLFQNRKLSLNPKVVSRHDRLRCGRGTARAEDAQGTPTQSRIPPSILVYEDNQVYSNTKYTSIRSTLVYEVY